MTRPTLLAIVTLLLAPRAGAQDAGQRAPGARVVSVRAIAISPVVARAGIAPDSVAELHRFIAARESQLRFCYVEWGYKIDPALAGDVRVRVTTEGWRARDVTFASTSQRWRGEGARQAEKCWRARIGSWRLPIRGTGESRFETTLAVGPHLVRLSPGLDDARRHPGRTTCALAGDGRLVCERGRTFGLMDPRLR